MIKILYSAILLVTMVSSAHGKGITVELSITGPGMSAPIHTSDAGAIDVNVWGGNFADWEKGVVDEPSLDLGRYLVHFWIQLPRSTTVQLKYVVWYVWDSDTQRALVYLPGPKDQWYRTNTYSILREGVDGHWFYASRPWGLALKKVLQIGSQWSAIQVTAEKG